MYIATFTRQADNSVKVCLVNPVDDSFDLFLSSENRWHKSSIKFSHVYAVMISYGYTMTKKEV